MTMNRQQALRLLGLSEDDDGAFIRTRYRQLMKQYHPDTGMAENELEMAQKLTEAYRILKAEASMGCGKNVIDWGLRENSQAFTKRTIFLEDVLFGHDITAETGIRGRFYWDPEMESFMALLKSVSAEVSGILERDGVVETSEALENSTSARKVQKQAKLLHLLLQEFINPYECLEALLSLGRIKREEQIYRIPCHLKPLAGKKAFKDRELLVYAKESRLYAAEEEGLFGSIHFNENEFYYIITPLILRKEASGKVLPDREKSFSSGSKKPHFSGILNLTLKKTAGTDPTEKINQEIRRMLKE